MEPPAAFLDANVLFSAALGGPVFDLIRELGRAGRVRLVTSEACVREALENLQRKRPSSSEAFDGVLLDVEVYPLRRLPDVDAAASVVGQSDAHVLAAAIALEAAVLITGDKLHFGELMSAENQPIRVMTPRAYLESGPEVHSPGEL